MSEQTLTQDFLNHFTGSGEFYRHWSKLLIYTEGVQAMAEVGKAFWLIDAITSYQLDERIQQNQALKDFQVWKLVVEKADNQRGATLTMRGDSNQPVVITQKIEYTDFPLPEITLWVSNDTLMLPSEY